MPEPELRVVAVSNLLTDTPEGMYRWDRLVRAAADHHASLAPEAVPYAEAVERELERAFLEGR